MLYLDYNSTCPPQQDILLETQNLYFNFFGNSSGRSLFSQKASTHIEEARSLIASILNVDIKQLVFTSSASEANAIALWSLRNYFIEHKKKEVFKVLYSPLEHPSIIETLSVLPNTVLYPIPININGEILINDIESIIRDEQIDAIVLMSVHNETGLIFPIAEVIEIMERYEPLFLLCDSVQLLYKLRNDFDIHNLSLSIFNQSQHKNILFTLAGHKIGAGFGTGILILPNKNNFNTIEGLSPFRGGFQEFTWRAGSHNLYSIVSFARVLENLVFFPSTYLLLEELTNNFEQKITSLLSEYLSTIENGMSYFQYPLVVGKKSNRLAGTSLVLFPKVSIDFLLMKLDQNQIVVSTGTSCKSNSRTPSKGLLAMGYSEELALSAIRFSYNIDFSLEEQNKVIEILRDIIPKILC